MLRWRRQHLGVDRRPRPPQSRIRGSGLATALTVAGTSECRACAPPPDSRHRGGLGGGGQAGWSVGGRSVWSLRSPTWRCFVLGVWRLGMAIGCVAGLQGAPSLRTWGPSLPQRGGILTLRSETTPCALVSVAAWLVAPEARASCAQHDGAGAGPACWRCAPLHVGTPPGWRHSEVCTVSRAAAPELQLAAKQNKLEQRKSGLHVETICSSRGLLDGIWVAFDRVQPVWGRGRPNYGRARPTWALLDQKRVRPPACARQIQAAFGQILSRFDQINVGWARPDL